MTDPPDLPTRAFASSAAWERWLERSHASAPGIWLKFAKKESGVASVSRSDAIDMALCFGWIDGQVAPLDERFWLTRFTPRRPRSRWSQRNRDRATALIADGRMRPAGLEEVERAQGDGRWDAAYPGQASAAVPEDLAQALAATPCAAEYFATLDRVNRYAILYRLHDAKRPATRAARLERFIQMLARHEKIHP
ncbi:MAG: YdeI/OmpD-associated family protein [Solirubrobacteraceae bacterium]